MKTLKKGQDRSPLLLLLCLLLVALGLGAWQEAARKRDRAMPVDEVVALAATPFLRAGSAAGRWVDRRLEVFARGARLARDNRKLEKEVARLKAENLLLAEKISRQQRLQPLLASARERSRRALPASVVGRTDGSAPGTLLLDRGRQDGLTVRLPVVSPKGAVGQVYGVTATTARVLPLTAPASGAAALVRRSRVQGVLTGTGKPLCELRCPRPEADVRKGDLILTAGQGGVYPRGLLIGRVVRVTRDPRTSTRVALVSPAVDFDSLEEVVVYLAPHS
jgi:rod shape-determining protein MreC